MAIATIVVIAGLILLIVGIKYDVPNRKFSFRTLEEYVGGDAYNAMIEASIRGGEIAAAKTSKTIYICSGTITMAMRAINSSNRNKQKERKYRGIKILLKF